MKLLIDGIRCGDCIRTIVGALLKMDLGARINVDPVDHHVRIEGRLTVEDASTVIEGNGFKVASVVDSNLIDATFRTKPGLNLAI